jgi:hypothetical protein
MKPGKAIALPCELLFCGNKLQNILEESFQVIWFKDKLILKSVLAILEKKIS